MEDNLDKFVRKSFDDYEELPSDGMWDRIEAGLPQPLSFWQAYRWQMAAGFALVFMACGLLAQHFYYQDKIRTLATETPAPAPARPQAVPLVAAPGAAPTTSNGQSAETAVPSQNQEALVALKNTLAHTKPLVTGSVAPQVDANQTTRAQDALGSGAQRGQRPSNTQNPEDKASVAAEPFRPKKVGEGLPPAAEPSKPAEGDVAAASSAKRILETLPFTPYQPIQSDLPQPEAAAAPTLIKPVQTLSGWYAALSVAPTYSREQLPAPPNNGKPGGPGWPGWNEPRKFGNDTETTTYTTDYWLRLGKKSRHPFGVESGIGYRDLVRTAQHKPSFELKDGHPHGGGPHGPRRDYDFNYQLEAYGGTAEISLRMEQTDSSITLPDKEPLNLEIKTRQRIQTLRVPLLATLQGGKGQWRWGVKAGPVANFVLSNKLDIEKVCSLNQKLQPELGNNMPKPGFENTQSFMLGYWASMNLEYRLSKNWSVVLEPSISGNFNTQTVNDRPLPRETSASLGLGVQRYF